MRLVIGLIALACICAWVAPAFAEEMYLQWDDGVADSYSFTPDRAHFIYFQTPEDWTDSLCSSVRFYGRSFGDVSGIFGTVVVYAPPEDRDTILGSSDEHRMQVLARNQFRLSDVPEDGGWLDVSVDPVKVDGEFGIAIYTFSTEENGVEIGLSAPTAVETHSGDFWMTKVRIDKEVGTDVIRTSDFIELRHDTCEWMIRAFVSPTVAPPEQIELTELDGSNIGSHDDGEADSFHTSQRYGPIVRFDAAEGARVNGVYVMAYLEGDWFETDREASVYLMDDALRILQRKKLAYNKYATEPAWGLVEFDDIAVTGVFYILVEPVSRPAVKMYIGCDTSGENQGSLWGTAGTILAWDSEAPEESANWMIRVRFD